MHSAFHLTLALSALISSSLPTAQADFPQFNPTGEDYWINEIGDAFSIYSPLCEKTVFRARPSEHFSFEKTDGVITVKNGCVKVASFEPVASQEQCADLPEAYAGFKNANWFKDEWCARIEEWCGITPGKYGLRRCMPCMMYGAIESLCKGGYVHD